MKHACPVTAASRWRVYQGAPSADGEVLSFEGPPGQVRIRFAGQFTRATAAVSVSATIRRNGSLLVGGPAFPVFEDDALEFEIVTDPGGGSGIITINLASSDWTKVGYVRLYIQADPEEQL